MIKPKTPMLLDKTKFIFFLFALLIQANQMIAQSLEQTLKNDTIEVQMLIEKSKEHFDNPELGLKYISLAFEKSVASNYIMGIMRSLNIGGTLYMMLGNYKGAIDCFRHNLYLSYSQGNLKFLSWSYSNLGEIFRLQNKLDQAIEYLNKSLKIDIYRKDIKGLAVSYNSIGIIYNDQKKLDSALHCYEKSLIYYEKVDDSNGIALSSSNIGQLYIELNDFDKAYQYLNRSLIIRNKIKDSIGLAYTYDNIAFYYHSLNDLNNYYKNILNAQRYTKNSFYSEINIEILLKLSEYYREKGDFKNAYSHYVDYTKVKDSIYKQENLVHLEKMDWQNKFFEYKKNLEIKNTIRDIENASNLKRQRLLRNIFIIGFLFSLLISIIIFRLYSDKKKSNRQLMQKKAELELQKNEIAFQKNIIENKNKNIVESLNYAKRIQLTLLPSNKSLSKIFPESFIFYVPKNIVSGDFYWAHEKSSHKFFATIDCTGHGVPGALLTIFAFQLLNEAVNYLNLNEPNKILNYISHEIFETFQQKNDEWTLKDGMDIALIAINKDNLQLAYAGVGLSLLIWDGENSIELKPDILPIGKIDNDSPANYSIHYHDLSPSTIIYSFTDGFADQIGGEHKKKYLRKPFKQMLLSNSHLSLWEQQQKIESTFYNWKADNEQVDDVLVAGIRVYSNFESPISC